MTNPERFRPLHQLALALLDRLAAEYDVSRSEAFDPVRMIRPGIEHARPPIRLTPTLSRAAPIAIAFTPFPSLLVRCGRWLEDSYPVCGCDACGATAEREWERLEVMLDHVVAGRFREEISIPCLLGSAKLSYELGATLGHRQGGWGVLPRPQARVLLGGGPRIMEWQPWPARDG